MLQNLPLLVYKFMFSFVTNMHSTITATKFHKMKMVSYVISFLPAFRMGLNLQLCFRKPFKSRNGLCFCYPAVQIVIGSFLADGKLELDPGLEPEKPVFAGFLTANSPSSKCAESSGGYGSPPNTAGSNTGSQPSFANYPPWK